MNSKCPELLNLVLPKSFLNGRKALVFHQISREVFLGAVFFVCLWGFSPAMVVAGALG